jgi:hypothetical protein
VFSVVRASVCVSTIVRFPTSLTAVVPYFEGFPVHTQRPFFTFLATRIGAKHGFFVQVDIWFCLYFYIHSAQREETNYWCKIWAENFGSNSTKCVSEI